MLSILIKKQEARSKKQYGAPTNQEAVTCGLFKGIQIGVNDLE
ncbi:hypothetical protein CCACVL1_28145, partial [Corchorus capsularis]